MFFFADKGYPEFTTARSNDTRAIATGPDDGGGNYGNIHLYHSSCADPESFVRVGPTSTTFFHFLEDPNTTISGPSSARQRNAIQMAFRWRAECWLDSFVIFQGIRTSIAKKSYIFVIVQGGGGANPLPPPPLRIRA